MTNYLAYFKDPSGFVRAWGLAKTLEDAKALALRELAEYRAAKRLNHDPLADATFTAGWTTIQS